ncbi:hypothetical protein, partial [Streptomyces sp. NRRL B-24085]|uniref:hypothetical protein n=1 Tax=Streptomyces sp. NRRL B-24085 TaxID=1709476 RepID=UPI0006B3544C
MRVLAVWGAVLVALVGGGTAAAVGGPEADLAYHGAAAMSGGRVDVRFTPRNHGPSAVPDATVRLRWSEPLVNEQTLPRGCARSEERVVLRVRLRGAPSEVLLEIDTVWNGGT